MGCSSSRSSFVTPLTSAESSVSVSFSKPPPTPQVTKKVGSDELASINERIRAKAAQQQATSGSGAAPGAASFKSRHHVDFQADASIRRKERTDRYRTGVSRTGQSRMSEVGRINDLIHKQSMSRAELKNRALFNVRSFAADADKHGDGAAKPARTRRAR